MYIMKVELYKKSIINYIKNNKLNNIIIGVLFLTEMNRNCKLNNIYYHGYYIATSLIYLYDSIINNIFNKSIISNTLIDDICKNIKYLNELKYEAKIKINNNLYLLILEINKYLNIINSNIEINYINIIDNLFKPFFYILLIISKFMTCGVYNEPNLLKIAEYYSNIFYAYHFINIENKQQLYELYHKNLVNLNSSILELNIYNNTINEILDEIKIYILNNL